MKVKRVVPILLSLAMVGGSLGMFAGCNGGDGGDGGHTHDYEGQPVLSGDNGHYQECKVEGCTERNYGHMFNHFEETCDYCDYPNPAYADSSSSGGGADCEHPLDETKWTSAGAAGHYHRATCEHKDQHSAIQQHNLSGGACTDCTYVKVTYSTPTATDTSTKFTGKIYVVGDSTVCDFSDDYYLPRKGYGTELATYLNIDASNVVNLALSGRSSKSFITETQYGTLTSSITAGDYLIIGFGHNDEKSAEPARFCDPAGSKDVENTSKGTSFKWSLYQKYIKVAQDAGATPILCTPIVRYDDKGEYSGSKVHNTSDGNYAQAIIELGEEVNVPVIDLTGATRREYLNDVDGAAYYHAHTKYYAASNDDIKAQNTYDGTERPVGKDDTHINKFGAKMVAYNFAQLLLKTDCGLKNSVKTNMAHPTKSDDYVGAIKQTFEMKAYTPFNAANYASYKLATVKTDYTTSNWYKTYMGVGSSGHNATYADGKFTLTTTNKSKFASTQDGFGAAFTQINIKKDFIASVKAKVTSAPDNVGGSDQNAFGLMLRDDLLMNTEDTALASNFITAGMTGRGKFAFSRSSATALTFSGKTTTFATDKEYTFTIERIGQTVNVSVNDGTTTVTHKFTDFDFVAIDSNYMYLCLFANRELKVEFTDLSYKVTGIAQSA
ncbi:MAG: hypothetical protein K2N47_02620 [Clostridia bacterium]|nr:hypothetical protein [Clostridia bacterium]